MQGGIITFKLQLHILKATSIDLTLDSDDEDSAPPPPPPRPVEKRGKYWKILILHHPGRRGKKARLDSSVPLTVARNINGNANGISGGGSES